MKTATIKITPEVMTVLEAAVASPAGIVLTGQLDRKLYEQVNKVLAAAGFSWKRQAKAHIHPDADPGDALDSMIALGSVVNWRKTYQFFETSGIALSKLIEAAEIEQFMTVLEPSAGSGNLVAACTALGARVDAIEIQAEMANRLLMSGAFVVVTKDFLSVDPLPGGTPQYYDRVVMNPPFSRQQDIDHVTHAMGFLKPGGRLVAIMSGNALDRHDLKTRAFLERITAWGYHSEPLPEGAFKASGTSVNTLLLTMDRPN